MLRDGVVDDVNGQSNTGKPPAQHDVFSLREGETGILGRLRAPNLRDESPIDRGYRYLRRAFDIDRCYQATLSRTPDFMSRTEMPEEAFSSAIILDLLMASRLSSRIKSRITEYLGEYHEHGVFSYFMDTSLLPRDVDVTGLALSVLIKLGVVPMDVAHSAASKVLQNVNDTGVIHVYLPPRGEREGRYRIDPVPCANALYLAYLLGREGEARPTEEYLIGSLSPENAARPSAYYYYLTPDGLLYWASRLLEFETFRQRYAHLIEDVLRARIGSSDVPLELAYRVIAANRLRIDDTSEREALRAAQNADGSWPASPMYKLGRSDVYVGSEALVTAFALRALDDQ
ncbi:hypothetical protein WMF31_36125 [Sorangium sp. So ce1036]|uniref:hypothetical protein n=1 Tax=Sorangium sp. So ce1036 TaxID=3133328 RepID=UPI003F109CCB